MIEKYAVLDKVRKNDADPLDMLKKSNGDAYDYAVIFAKRRGRFASSQGET